MVLWLRLHPPTAGGAGLIPDGGEGTKMVCGRAKKKNFFLKIILLKKMWRIHFHDFTRLIESAWIQSLSYLLIIGNIVSFSQFLSAMPLVQEVPTLL